MCKVLIVEDTLVIREEVLEILLLEGYTVYEAENGRVGYEMALRENPDLIISDILMPELDGFEMFRKLQNDTRTKGIPLIFLSARAKKEHIQKGMILGAEDYLTKPISVSDLVTAIEKSTKLVIKQ